MHLVRKWVGTLKRKTARTGNTSLFLALCLSFAGIIVLLMTFNYLTYTFFRQNIREEIIKSNSLNLSKTVTNYENHIVQLKSYLMSYLFRPDTQAIADNRNRRIDYERVRKVQVELQSTISSSLLFIDNLIYYLRGSQLLLDKDGSRDPDTMFSKLYVGDGYSADFWDREITKLQSFHLYPAVTFKEITAFGQNKLGVMIPVLVKKENDDQFGLIAMLSGTSMYAFLHQPIEDGSFYMFDRDGRTVFASLNASTAGEPMFEGVTGHGHLERGDVLYLYQQGESGFLYVDKIPLRNISQQIRRLNVIFVVIVLMSLVLSLLLALLLARRFHNPLSGLVQAIGQLGQTPSLRPSRIKEFNLLSDKLNDLFRTQHDIHRDLDAKNSLLQHYAYISRLKMISTNIADIKTAIDADKPYRLILLHLVLKEQSQAEMAIEPHRAYALIKEMVQHHFSNRCPDSLTFQTEQDHILTILFERERSEASLNERSESTWSELNEELEPLVELLRPETPYFNFTIGTSPTLRHSEQFAEAYEEVQELVRQRTLGEQIQLFTERVSLQLPLVPTLAQEQKLATNLHVGNDVIVIPLVHRLIQQLGEAGAPAHAIQALSRQIVEKAIKVIYAQSLVVPGYENSRQLYEELKKCYTLEQYEAFFQTFLSAFALAVRDKKAAAETDYMITFVKDYVESNYGSDISLDLLSQKLNITSSYLSTYFKEKTGTNLSEYTHTLRMNKASEMLQNTDLKIQDIASLVGYFTVAPFNRAFKRHTGVTPGEFRRQHQAPA
ncbi:helix-turn-helix domain-containing protein [Paenibacillus koleovorans]|uniref:helix-turn-helix domain-containing protein n=1 Tax=Paenibacillus koleovorans TaxID=121608 RepID=UPI0013E2A41D|nr:AraC family transcriptional regulator [Paenibacillus koleovorans]